MSQGGRIAEIHTGAGQAQLLEDAGKMHDPPPGFLLQSDDERAVWEMLMQTRAYKSWTPADLIVAYRVVRLEMLIRKGSATLDNFMMQGADPFDEDSIAFTYNKHLMVAQKNQVFMLRALGFTRGMLPNDATGAKRAMAEREMNDTLTNMPTFLAAR
jgi:hypothetical protein